MIRFFRVMPYLLAGLLLMLASVALAQNSNDEITLPIDDDVNYTVRPGDTLDTVGSLFDVAPRCLAESNDLPSGTRLQTGQTLLIDATCPLYPRLRAGEDVIPPQVRFPREAPADTPGQGGGGSQAYRVRPGDTLDTIAQAFDVSAVSLQLANDLERPGELAIDMMLTIPDDAPPYGTFPAIESPAPGQLYTVQVGETLDDIAQQFDVALRALETVNGISPGRNALPGTVIFIPADVPAYGDDDAFDPAQALGQGGGAADDFHVVQPRETIDTIAAFYDISRECLAETNTIDQPRLLQPGTVLLIDTNCPGYVPYNTRPPLDEAVSGADATTDDAPATSETETETEADTGESVPLGERDS